MYLYKGESIMQKKYPNILKRIGAILLAFMCLILPVSAFAAEDSTIDVNQKGSITIYKYNLTDAQDKKVYDSSWKPTGKSDPLIENAMRDYAIEDVEFTYAKVADISTANVNGEVQVVYDIDPKLALKLGLSGKTQYTSNEINRALADKLRSNSSQVKMELEGYLGNTAATVTTDKTGKAKAEDLALGLYLLVETKFPNNISVSVDPFFVSVPMTEPDGSGWFYDVTVYPKNQTDTPTIDKLVRQDAGANATYNESATGSIGDKMDYIFVSKLPKITASTPLDTYTFTDIADKGLTYNKDATVYFYTNEGDAKKNNSTNAVETWTIKDPVPRFTQDTGSSNDGNSTMTITPTTEGYEYINNLNTSSTDYYMVVAYSATINENAILGDNANKNKVTLTWKRASSSTAEQLEDNAKVYTYGLHVNKQFDTDGGDLSAVEFILYNDTDKYYVTASGSNGNYKVTENKTVTAKESASKFTPNSKTGDLIIDGLEPDTYILTEVKTSGGFSLLKDSITIVITNNGTTASATINGSATNMSPVGNSTDARVDLTVINHANFTLPATGGMGTLLFTLAGCLVGLIAIVLITGKKRTE